MVLGHVGPVTAGDAVAFDLTGMIFAAGEYSISVVSESADKVTYLSKESESPPELIIEADLNAESKGVNGHGKGENRGEADGILPEKLSLIGNYPNPFNLETTIEYALPEDTKVRLIVYNLRGREVRTLIDEEQTAGTRRASWDGRDSHGREVASSVYFVRLEVGDIRLTRKILLQK